MVKKKQKAVSLTAQENARLRRMQQVGVDPATLLTVLEGLRAEAELRFQQPSERTLRWMMVTEAFDAAIVGSDVPLDWIDAARRALLQPARR